MKYEISKPLAIHQLGKRENQEDAIFPALDEATAEDRLFILCDGMGGHAKGEVASQTVCQELSEFIMKETDRSTPFTDNMLDAAMKRMYQVLNEKSQTIGDSKMGTTMVFLYFHPGGVMAAHIGDSRYYHIRPKTHSIVYRSKDHSLVNQLLEVGQITQEEVATMKGKNVILRAIMPNQETPAKPDIIHIKDIRPGDWFYMCSDGMLEQMNDEELLNIICNDEMTEDQKRNCLSAATDENKDNHSAYLIHVGGVMHEIIDEDQPDDETYTATPNIAEVVEEDHSTAVVETEPEIVVEATNPRNNLHNASPVYMPQKTSNKSLWITMIVATLILVIGAVTYFALKKTDEQKRPVMMPQTDMRIINPPKNDEQQIDNPDERTEEQTSERPSYTMPTPSPSKSRKATKAEVKKDKTTDNKDKQAANVNASLKHAVKDVYDDVQESSSRVESQSINNIKSKIDNGTSSNPNGAATSSQNGKKDNKRNKNNNKSQNP
jgi:protein phosphatase